MTTNVKPGDQAFVVAPYAMRGRGAFVTVLRRAQEFETLNGRICQIYPWSPSTVAWVVEGWVRDEDGTLCGPLVPIGDEALRRVEPPGLDDEVEDLVGLPGRSDRVCDPVG